MAVAAIVPRTVLAFILAASCGTDRQGRQQLDDRKVIAFSNGKVQFRVPKDYLASSEPDDAIAVRPSDTSAITLRLNLHYLQREVDYSPDLGVRFIHDQAALAGREVERITDKIVLKTDAIRDEGGRKFQMTFWLIGVSNIAFLLQPRTCHVTMNLGKDGTRSTLEPASGENSCSTQQLADLFSAPALQPVH